MDIAVLEADQLVYSFQIGMSDHGRGPVGWPEVERGDMDGDTVLHPEQGDPLDVVFDRIRVRDLLSDGDLDNPLPTLRALDEFDHRDVFLFAFFYFRLDQIS